MKRLLVIITGATALVCASCAIEHGKDKEQASKLIAKFHEWVQTEQLDSIWSLTDPKFREAGPQEKFNALLHAIKTKLDKVKESNQVAWTVNNTIGNGSYYTVVYKTTFEQGEGNESFNFKTGNDTLSLVGYNIQSMDLITK